MGNLLIGDITPKTGFCKRGWMYLDGNDGDRNTHARVVWTQVGVQRGTEIMIENV